MLHPLEPRRLFAVTVANPIASRAVLPDAATQTVALADVFRTTNINGTVVRFNTELNGQPRALDLLLFDKSVSGRSAAPTTTANFLNYVNAGRYSNTVFHRALNFTNNTLPAQFLQGGGFIANPSTGSLAEVPDNAPIPLEFSNDRPNTRGTLAMARGDNFNSATSGFFFNTVDNTSVFNATNPYAVFAQVLPPGLAVLDQYAALPRINTSFIVAPFPQPEPFTGVPVSNAASGNAFANLVILRSASVVPDADKTFAYSVNSSDVRIVNPTLTAEGLSLDYGTNTGTATVTLTARDLAGEIRTTTFNVTVGTPTLQVSLGKAKIPQNPTSPVNLGQAFPGQTAALTRTFTLRNTGKGPLTLGTVIAPSGFTVVTQPPATLAPGQSASLVLSLDTSAPGVSTGTLTVPANIDADGTYTFGLTARVSDTLTLGAGGAKSIVYTDADGSRVTYSLSGPGSAALTFTGTGLSLTTSSSGTATVTGPTSVLAATLTGTTTSTSLSASVSGGDRVAVLGSLSSTTPLRTLGFRAVTLTEALTLPAAASLQLGTLDSATLTLGNPAIASAPTSVTLGNVTGSTVSLSGSLRSVVAADVTDSALAVNNPVSTLTLRNVVGSSLFAATSVSKLTLTTLQSSSLRVGTAVTVPTAASDFVAGSAITTLSITGRGSDAFSGSSIAAALIGKASLGTLTPAGAASFLTATSIAQLSGRPPAPAKAFSLRAIDASTPIDATLAQLGLPTSRLDVTAVA